MEESLSKRTAWHNILSSFLVLGLIVLAVFFFKNQALHFYNENKALNTLIIITFAIGICYSIFWMFYLQREFKYLEKVRHKFTEEDKRWLDYDTLSTALPRTDVRDRLTLYAYQVDRSITPNADAHSEKIHMTLGLHVSTTRYVASLLVFLGLLGTFIGLLMTIQGVNEALATDLTAVGAQFDMQKLSKPLAGMATAFSTSVFGLTTSLVLGFVHLQLASAQTRFLSRFEALDTSLFRPAFQAHATRGSVSLRADVQSGNLTEGIARYLEATQRQLTDNLDRLMLIVERTEGMQANFREVMLTLGQEIEMTNSAMKSLGTNQDMMREALSSLVDYTRAGGESQRLTLSEMKGINEGLVRSHSIQQSSQAAMQNFHEDLVRVMRRELGAIDKMND